MVGIFHKNLGGDAMGSIFNTANPNTNGFRVSYRPYNFYGTGLGSIPLAEKAIFAADVNSAAVGSGGIINTTTSSSYIVPSGVNRFRIFVREDGGGQVHGTLSRISFYPTRLPDSVLQALTYAPLES